MEGSATPIVEPESKFGSNVEGTETPIVEAESKFGSTVEGSETPAVEPEPKDGSTVEASENDNPIVEAASNSWASSPSFSSLAIYEWDRCRSWLKRERENKKN